MAEIGAKKQTPSTAGADHPLREQTRACRGFGTAAQQSTVEHASGAAASQNTAAVTDQPAAPIKPDTEQMRMATTIGSRCSARISATKRAIRSLKGPLRQKNPEHVPERALKQFGGVLKLRP